MDRKWRGAGLGGPAGLAIVKEIVEAHWRGVFSLRVQSAKGNLLYN